MSCSGAARHRKKTAFPEYLEVGNLGLSACSGEPSKLSRRLRWIVAVLTATAAISLLAGLESARLTGARASWQSAVSFPARLLSLSSAHTADRGTAGGGRVALDDVSQFPPQLQAEHLLARSIQGSEDALEQISIDSGSWRGHIQETPSLFALVRRALASGDLRVRNAAMDIDLAANGLSKTPKSVERLITELHAANADRTWNLWRLGALGHRGVEPGVALGVLLRYARDREENTRLWALEGLAALGTDATIDPLLDALHGDPSERVRRSAAVNLAASGMLTPEQRMAVIPDLLNFLDDDSLNNSTRGLVYATLRGITGEALGNDANAWRQWWATHDTSRKQSSRLHLLRA